MEKGRKKLWVCLCTVVILAVIVGILYYYGQLQEQSQNIEGTLVANVGTRLRRLWP